MPYLHELGIGALYSSPQFRARRGSEHGYDVASPLRVNSELGTEQEFDELCTKLKHYGLGLMLDIVPNHMAASHENPWWMDVLENGPSSAFAHYFDIDWHPATTKAAFLQENKVVLPVLGNLYGNVLENQELLIRFDETGFYVRYYDRKLPLDPGSYEPILQVCVERLKTRLGAGHKTVAALEELRKMLRDIPPRTAVYAAEKLDRFRLAQHVKDSVFALYRDESEVRLEMDAALHDIGGVKGEPESFALLHRVLDDQAYRLAFWKIAFEEINYRRFFDVNDLVCLRVEEEDVFRARHSTIFQLIAEGKVTALRVDHLDGLHDPATYLSRLQSSAGPLYVVAEKILAQGESYPDDWETAGTTGYDFTNVLNDVFIDANGFDSIEQSYADFTGYRQPFAELGYGTSKQVMWRLFAGEVNSLGHHLGKLAAQHRQARDVPLSELIEVLVEVTACLPVYRTYIRDNHISERDRKYIEQTLALARKRTTDDRIGCPAFKFLRSVLLLKPPPYAPELQKDYLRFVMRWQQFTGPVMAKGLEDTASYIHNSLVSRNEVGADSTRVAGPLDVAGFHAFNRERLQRSPHTMSATSTHDTKRSEDVRARINVLSEMAADWNHRLLRWRKMNLPHKQQIDGMDVPTPSEESLIYQTMIGIWPFDPADEKQVVERIKAYLVKAVREAKQHSGWISPNAAHENAVTGFVEAILAEGPGNRFRRDFLSFQERTARHGAINALSQVLMKITAPGVPDFYQGSELWTFTLVDPDNRPKVDYRQRLAIVESLRRVDAKGLPRLLKELTSHWKDGRIKLHLTDRALDLRRSHASVFLDGAYIPIVAEGTAADSVVAFARAQEGYWAISVAPRASVRLSSARSSTLAPLDWGDTAIVLPAKAPAAWRNVLTGEAVMADGGKVLLSTLLGAFPVALLEGQPSVQ